MPIADRFTVVLDANVLYPFVQRDVLLSMAKAGLFRARWTDEIVEEWTRNLLARKPDLKPKVDRTVEIMRAVFEECWVEGFEELVEALTLPDDDDRHVLATAIRCGATHIVTNNLKHFPESALTPYRVTAISPDAFVANTFQLYPQASMSALHAMRQRYEKPPMTQSEFLAALIAGGFVRTAAQIREHVELL